MSFTPPAKTAKTPKPPLADAMRPRILSEVAGQSHLLGAGMPLRVAFESGNLHSFILYGPPGVGKTTIGRLAAQAADCEFAFVSAAISGIKEVRQAVDEAARALAEHGRGTVLFVDEIHSFNKTQQDALLPHVESGLIILVGSTTNHPGFSVNNALLSRAQVYEMKPLSHGELMELYARARSSIEADIEPPALDILAGFADGDGRRFLNLVEQVANAAKAQGRASASADFAKASTSPSLRRFDQGGDLFYEQLSAFHKSIRGSSPDGALYWLARMIDGGGDARDACRRMVAIASEDIGNADPAALGIAISAWQAYERMGHPEGELAVAHAATYLACAPKSNAAYAAWKTALATVKADPTREVPMHLRNAPTALQEQMGYKKGYRYAHDEPGAYAAGQTYFPDSMGEQKWYIPSERGAEKRLADKLAALSELDRKARGSAGG